MPFLFPRKFFQWIFEKNIDVLEKGKFALNLILGLCVGPHTRPNGALYACVRKEEIEKFIHAFCHVMFETPQKVQHKVMELFFETLKNTWQNTNSVSLAWSQGNTKPVLYFVNTMKDSLKNTTHSLQAQFITEFLAIYEKKQNLSTQDSL
jgi:alpha-tubulin suppressor-like RCC1 family protein